MDYNLLVPQTIISLSIDETDQDSILLTIICKNSIILRVVSVINDDFQIIYDTTTKSTDEISNSGSIYLKSKKCILLMLNNDIYSSTLSDNYILDYSNLKFNWISEIGVMQKFVVREFGNIKSFKIINEKKPSIIIEMKRNIYIYLDLFSCLMIIFHCFDFKT
jgi:hypothetical protein